MTKTSEQTIDRDRIIAENERRVIGCCILDVNDSDRRFVSG